MRLDLKKDVVSLTEFARNTKQHAMELAQGGRARILTQNGKASVVVLSLDAFEKMSREAEEYQLDQRLLSALETYAAGDHGTAAKSTFAVLQVRHQKRALLDEDEP